jgi:hypothetical protein
LLAVRLFGWKTNIGYIDKMHSKLRKCLDNTRYKALEAV